MKQVGFPPVCIRTPPCGRSGFTLIELSIVLVIIGLVIGGVLAGQSLSRDAQLRNIINSLQGYATAYENFRTKYNAVPGDMANASGIINGASDGNGDGVIYNSSTGITAAQGEDIKAWQHLSFANMVPFKFTAGSFGTPHVLGTQMPKGLIDSTGYRYESIPNWEGGNASIYGLTGTTIRIEGVSASNNNAGVISAQDAMNIDKKIDDGIGATGSFIAFRGVGNNFSDCINGSTGWTDPGSKTYNLATTDNKCIPLLFVDKP